VVTPLRWRQSNSLLALAALVLPLFACGGSTSSAPVAPTPAPPAATTPTVNGRAVDVFSTAPLAAVTVRLQNSVAATTVADGSFSISTASGQYAVVVLTGTGVVERQTGIRVPGPDALVTLIPTTFDLAAFDQMCRAAPGQLRRWDAAPKLVVIDAVLQFTSITDSASTATAERLSPTEREGMVADLTWGLPQATGDTFRAFSAVTIESPEVGAQVPFFTREGTIVVARFLGLQAATGYRGYGRWASRSNVVVAGAIMVDRNQDAAAGMNLRALRVHEMGHALGYDHVAMTTRVSFMNNSGVILPNAFDRDATRLAFLRPPGNLSPDRDPDLYSANFRSFPMVWGPITP
jgi:hypothetical protein